MKLTSTHGYVGLGVATAAAVATGLPTLYRVSGCIRSEVWPTSLLVTMVSADAVIAMAYAWIPFTLIGVWRRRRDVPLSWTLVSFAAFIVLCGMTHALAIVTAFWPFYWLAAEVHIATAAVSLATAYLLQTRVGPVLLTLKSYGDVVADAVAARGESEELKAAKDVAEEQTAHAKAATTKLEKALADIEAGKLAAEALAEQLAVAKADADAARARAEHGQRRAVGEVADMQRALDELRQAEGTIAAQRHAIAELSTPILHIWTGVLTLPIIGMVDSRRAAEMTEALLDEIARTGARYAIVDVTGVGLMDTGTVAHLAGMARAAGLMGSTCVLTGLRPEVARTLVESGVEVSGVQTLRSLEQGLRWCIARIRKAKA